MNSIISVICLLLVGSVGFAQERWQTSRAEVSFKSDAPLELIEASSKELKGILDVDQKRFAFIIPIRSFKGFNTPLQRDHFNENYLDSEKFPKATFSGKIIGNLDLSKDGELKFRAKGKLNVHGVKQERIIKVNARLEDGILTTKASFTILLEEYGIAIPRIVYQKIAEEIELEVTAVFEPML